MREVSGVPVLMSQRIDHDPDCLEKIVRSLAPIPPRPIVRIRGTHRETRHRMNHKGEVHGRRKTVVDFDLKLDLTDYILTDLVRYQSSYMQLDTVENHVKTYRGTLLKKRMLGWKMDSEWIQSKPTLAEWCHRYCASAAHLKR